MPAAFTQLLKSPLYISGVGTVLENAVARYLNAGDRPRRLGSRHPLIAPFQAFPTKDEPIVVCVDTEAQWERFCRAIERADLIAHPLFTDGSARVRHHAELEPPLISALSKRTRAETSSRMRASALVSNVMACSTSCVRAASTR